MEQTRRKLKINPFVLVILSFALVILIGSILLTFPFTNTLGKNGEGIWLWNAALEDGRSFTYLDCLFTAVSATCVTGVSTYEIGFADSISFAGQLIVAIMIQIGGLGFITVLTFIITLIKSKLEFRDRYNIAQMVSATNFAEVVKFVRRLIVITAIIEAIGFCLGLPVFLTMYPNDVPRALWNSLFHTISAFNNAGFDLFGGTTSLIGGLGASGAISIADNTFLYYYFCSYIMVLILAGGISYLTIIDIFLSKKGPKQYKATTKIILLSTIVILLLGTLIIFLADGLKKDNPISLFHALFQVVTCRTAGFATYKPDDLSTTSQIVSCFIMFFGGAPLGTAGGIKITTIYLIVLSVFCYFRGKQPNAFKRSFSNTTVLKAMSLVFVAIVVLVISFALINIFGFENGKTYEEVQIYAATINPDYTFFNTGRAEAYLYELFSCFATTGFFVGFEPYLSVGSKIVLCLLMFIGRLGPMTFFQVFQKNMDKKSEDHYKLVEEEFLVG